MSKEMSPSSIAAAWGFMLVATLCSMSGTMPTVALTALALIGLASMRAVLAQARRPEPRLAEAPRAVDQGRTA